MEVFGIYQHLVDFAGAGATVPLTGFGNLLAKGAIQKVQENGLVGAFTGGTAAAVFTPYLVRVNTDVLNVRAGAGTGYKITTQIHNNEVYTIVAEKNKWGKLKSGAGWISLDYVKKI